MRSSTGQSIRANNSAKNWLYKCQNNTVQEGKSKEKYMAGDRPRQLKSRIQLLRAFETRNDCIRFELYCSCVCVLDPSCVCYPVMQNSCN